MSVSKHKLQKTPVAIGSVASERGPDIETMEVLSPRKHKDHGPDGPNGPNGLRGPWLSMDLFELQVSLTTLCKCLHASGQVPWDHFQMELHKTRFDAMLNMYPMYPCPKNPKNSASLQKVVQSENVLTHCLEFVGRSLALELFHTCRALSSGLKSNPLSLPGIYVTWGKKVLEWHPVPGVLTLDPVHGSVSRDFMSCHPAETQHRDTLFKCGGGFGGNLRRVTNAAFAFHKTKGTWQPLPSMVKKREGHSATVFRGKLYVCGGLNDDFAQESCGEESVHGTVECYDPNIGSWTQLPRMLTRRYLHACAAFQGRLYVCGGKSPDQSGGEGQLATVESFQPLEPSERRWAEMPSMLRDRSCQIAPFALKSVHSKLFAYGGTGHASTLECYNGRLWSEVTSFNEVACQSCVALTACQGYLYILSRSSASETEAARAASAMMQRFDPVSGMWQAIPLTVQWTSRDGEN